MNQSILLSISGKDKAGIVRDVSDMLFHAETNIIDSSMTVLRGRFTMMMIVELMESNDFTSFKAALSELEQRTGLSVQSQVLSGAEASHLPDDPDCVITVSGADKPGIVYAVTNSLAGLGISIDDVSTRSRGDVYMMVLEVVAGDKTEALKECLINVSEQLSVAIEVHHLDDDVM